MLWVSGLHKGFPRNTKGEEVSGIAKDFASKGFAEMLFAVGVPVIGVKGIEWALSRKVNSCADYDEGLAEKLRTLRNDNSLRGYNVLRCGRNVN